MANRHSHKKLRNEIVARMRVTGESYQRARDAVVSRRPTAPVLDLVPFESFRVPMTLVVFAVDGVTSFTVMGRAPRSGSAMDRASWYPSIRFLGAARGAN